MSKTLKETGHINSFDGTPIYYEVRGEGQPLIFVYGIGCLINHWHFQVKYFSKNYRTVAFDYRGHHKSGTPEDKTHLTIEALARDLNAVIEKLELKNPILVGHSFGTQVLLKFAELYPSVAGAYISINGFATNPIAGMFGNNAAENLFNLIKSGSELLPETLSSLWKWGVNNPISMHVSALLGGFNIHLTQFKDIEIYARGVSAMPLTTFIAFFESMMSFDGTKIFASIDKPFLVMGGTKDNVTPLEKQADMARQITNSELQVIPYGSHCTQLDFPDFVNLRVEKFIEERSLAQTP